MAVAGGGAESGTFMLRGPSPVVRAMLSSRSRAVQPSPTPPPSAAAVPAWAPDPEVRWKMLDFGGAAIPTPQSKRGRKRKLQPQLLSLPPTLPLPPPPQPLAPPPRPPFAGMHEANGRSFVPHVIRVEVGEDIGEKVMSFSFKHPSIVVIFSAYGLVSKAVLRQISESGSSDCIVTREGHFEIVSLSGWYLLSNDGNSCTQNRKLSVILAAPYHDVFGGGVVGLLIAASPIEVIVGSFLAEAAVVGTSAACSKESTGLSNAIEGSTRFTSGTVSSQTGAHCSSSLRRSHCNDALEMARPGDQHQCMFSSQRDMHCSSTLGRSHCDDPLDKPHNGIISCEGTRCSSTFGLSQGNDVLEKPHSGDQHQCTVSSETVAHPSSTFGLPQGNFPEKPHSCDGRKSTP